MADLTATRGDTNIYQIEVTRVDPDTDIATPVDLTGSKIWFTAKRKRKDLDTQAIISKGTTSASLVGIVLTDQVNGLAELTLDPEDTSDLASDFVYLHYDMQLWEPVPFPDGRYSTVSRGQLLVSDDITGAS